MIPSTSEVILIERVRLFQLYKGNHAESSVVNQFAGVLQEDLQGEIPSLCRDEHGCRCSQEELEEGLPEHRDMICRETFGHFPELVISMSGIPDPRFSYSSIMLQNHSETISAKSSCNFPRMGRGTLAPNLLHRIWSISCLTCMALARSKR